MPQSVVEKEVNSETPETKYSQPAQYSTDQEKDMVFSTGTNDNKNWEDTPVGREYGAKYEL